MVMPGQTPPSLLPLLGATQVELRRFAVRFRAWRAWPYGWWDPGAVEDLLSGPDNRLCMFTSGQPHKYASRPTEHR